MYVRTVACVYGLLLPVLRLTNTSALPPTQLSIAQRPFFIAQRTNLLTTSSFVPLNHQLASLLLPAQC